MAGDVPLPSMGRETDKGRIRIRIGVGGLMLDAGFADPRSNFVSDNNLTPLLSALEA